MKKTLCISLFCLLISQVTWAGRAHIKNVASEPYTSAIVINSDTGETLFADHADKKVYPASVLKLMVLLTILDQVDEGVVHLDDMVQITDEAYKMGGSQVYLDPSEQFPVDELLYALMIQSANDAAVALATHVAGSKEAFVDMMNSKARDLGMKNTHFYSVHGLPPSTGQEVDVTTARDFALLCRELAKRPEVFKYTSVKVRDFRDGKFIMRNHNHLLEKMPGCDGFKTGYFKAAGFSIAATAKRNDTRLIALVMGSQNRKVRDAKAIALLNKGFAIVAADKRAGKISHKQSAALSDSDTKKTTRVMPQNTALPVTAAPVNKKTINTPVTTKSNCLKSFLLGILTGAGLFAAFSFYIHRKRRSQNIRRPRL